MSDFTYATQYKINNIKIDGIDVMGLFVSLEIFENIFIPVVSGTLQIFDTDGGGFVDDNKIEFNEDFEFSIVNAEDETMTFKGVLNGVHSEVSNKNQKVYNIDFCTKEMRKNNMVFVSEKITDTPQNVVIDMVEKLEGKLNTTGSDGKKMEFIAGRWKPLHIIKHVLSHGVSNNSQATNSGKNVEETASGTSGFLCWQTIGQQNEYRFCSVDDLLKGSFESHGKYQMKLGMKGEGLEAAQKYIIEYHFNDMGDIQTKMKSGAFKCKMISFDMDTGLYKEFDYDASEEENLMSEKQKKIITDVTRVMMVPFTNDKFAKDCEAAQENTGDQSREYVAQNNVRQNTFNDSTGVFTLYPQFKMHAGDIIEVKINKVKSGADNNGYEENQKHSGKYVVKQIGHHFLNDGRAYSKVTTIRSTSQQDKQTARKV